MRRLLLSGVVACLSFAAACQRKSEGPNGGTAAATDLLLARIHFKGFDQLASSTNGTTLQAVWKLPETGTLRTMALDKLTPALVNLLSDGAGATNRGDTALLRPLLDDLLRSESVFEIIEHPNHKLAWTLAARVDTGRSDLWRENAGRLLQSAKPRDGAFQVTGKLTNGWVAVTFEGGPVVSGNTNTPLWREVASLPASVPSPHWFRADSDWPRLTNAIHAGAWLPLPRFDLTVLGKGDGLRTEARFHFTQPLDCPLETWRLPTNTIRDPLISFSALRGFQPWLKNQDWFQKMGLSSVPDQVVAWGQSDTPFQIQCAVPVNDATNELKRLAATWMPMVNSNLVRTPLDPLQFHTNVAQINTRMLFLVPFIRVAPESRGGFLNAGIFPTLPGTNAPPAALLEELNRTNLVYYDWEITQSRLGQLRETLDLLGTLLTLPTMGTNSAARRWVDAAAPRLGNTVTEITMTAPDELSLVRRSHIGLNGLELVALANWIEGANFPKIDFSVGFRPPPQTRRMRGGAVPPGPVKP